MPGAEAAVLWSWDDKQSNMLTMMEQKEVAWVFDNIAELWQKMTYLEASYLRLLQ